MRKEFLKKASHDNLRGGITFNLAKLSLSHQITDEVLESQMYKHHKVFFFFKVKTRKVWDSQ